MAILTPEQLSALNFGYLTGQDLVQRCSVQVLIKQWETNNNILQQGCDDAYSEIDGLFSTKYNVQQEFNIISGQRQNIIVRLASILAVRSILGNMAGIGEVTKMNFAWADEKIFRVQNGTFNLPLYAVNCIQYSNAPLVKDKFSYLG